MARRRTLRKKIKQMIKETFISSDNSNYCGDNMPEKAFSGHMEKPIRKLSISDRIIAYEMGEMEANKVLELVADLVKNGMAWTLQGHYGRMATAYIDAGFIDRQGNILKRI